MITIEDQIWMKLNKVHLKHEKGQPVVAQIEFGLTKFQERVFEADKAEGTDSKEAIQNLCDQNNMLSPWDLRKIKSLLSNDQKNSK
jgi:hypothetical protein